MPGRGRRYGNEVRELALVVGTNERRFAVATVSFMPETFRFGGLGWIRGWGSHDQIGFLFETRAPA